jgi:hypothetical protein
MITHGFSDFPFRISLTPLTNEVIGRYFHKPGTLEVVKILADLAKDTQFRMFPLLAGEADLANHTRFEHKVLAKRIFLFF